MQKQETKAVEADVYLRCFRCNQESEVVKQNGIFYVRCMALDCGLESPGFYSEGRAEEFWNEVPRLTAAESRVARLKEALQAAKESLPILFTDTHAKIDAALNGDPARKMEDTSGC